MNIQDLVYNTLKLKNVKETAENYMASCPFANLHGGGDDSSPSFSIHKETGIWQCFGCGSKGSLHQLLLQVGGMSPDQVRELSKRKASSSEDIKLKLKKIKEKGMPNLPIELPKEYTVNLSGRFVHYLYSRGITDECMGEFFIGCCEDGFYKDCVVLPLICNDKLVSFIARRIKVLESQQKYLFPQGTSKKDILFNYDTIHEGDKVYLVEGPFDVLKLWSLGLKNVCCVFGSDINTRQIRMLLFKNVEEVCVMTDGDLAGDRAAAKIGRDLSKFCKVTKIAMPEGKDPGDISDVPELNNILLTEE